MSKAEKAAQDLLVAYRVSVKPSSMFEVATRKPWRHSICVDHLCGCGIPGEGRRRSLNIHARSHDCHPEGERP